MENWREKLVELQKSSNEGRATMQDFFRLLLEMDAIARRDQAKLLGSLNRKIFFQTHGVFPFFLGALLEIVVLALGIWAGIAATVANSWLLIIIAQTLVIVGLHPLSHIMAGWFMGIRFLGFYLNGPLKIEPGVKVDYETFLLRSPGERALFFAAGVLGTLVGAFGVLAVGYLYPFPEFARVLLFGIALFHLISEFSPFIFIGLGCPRFLGFSWYRGDLYKALREWRLSS